jgi:hypothetical protein
MPSASAMSASVCLISSLSSGGSGLGKPGGKRGSLLTVSLLAWFELWLGLKNRQVGEKWVSDDCSYLCKGLFRYNFFPVCCK